MKLALYVLFVTIVFFCGCLSSRMDKYYLLNPKPVNERVSVTLRNIELPEYLEQNNLVRCVGENRIEFIEGHRWMGSFKEMFEEAIEDGLKSGEGRRVILKIRRLAAYDDGKFHAELECLEGDKSNRISFFLPCKSDDPDSIVSAYSAAVAEILKRLAAL